MPDEKERKIKHAPKTLSDESFPFYPVASATETTGMIPALPATDSQAEAYEDLMDIPTRRADIHPENGDTPSRP
jgi:hypothetical protein